MKSSQKPEKIGTKTKIDSIDRKIFNLLNRDARKTLKEIARQTNLSIDTVKRRMDRMRETGAIERIAAIPNPAAFGYPLTAHVYVKYQNVTDEKLRRFKEYLVSHDRVFIAMSMLGEYDMYFIIIAKDAIDLSRVKNDIRHKFSDLIADWTEMFTSEFYKYEVYNF